MSDNPLSSKVSLDTTAFKTGTADMVRQIKLIETGFKATAAALGDWGKTASGLEQRIKALTGEIDIQQKKVAADQAEFERLSASGKASQIALDKLQLTINKDTETLNKMKLELTQSTAALDGMGKEEQVASSKTTELAGKEESAARSTNTFSDKIKSLGSSLSATSAHIRDFAANVAKTLVGGLIGAVAGIGALVLKTAAAGDDLDELSQKTGISAARLQELGYIGKQNGIDMEVMTGSLSKMIRNMDAAGKGTGPAADAFKELGINVKDSAGQLRNSNDIWNEVITKLGGISNETERDATSMAIFGKTAMEMNPLVLLGADGMARMADEAHRAGAIMSDEDVKAAGEFNDKLDGLKSGFTGLIAKLAGGFMPLANKVADTLTAWLANPATQAGVKNLADGIGKFVDAFMAGFGSGNLVSGISNALMSLGKYSPVFAELGVKVVEISNFFQTLATIISNFVTTQVIPFVTAHGEEFKGALIGIGIALAAVAIVVPVVGALVAALSSPILLIVAAAALLGAAWAGNWGDIQGKTAAVWAWLQPVFAAIGQWLSVTIPANIAVMVAFWTVLVPVVAGVWNAIMAVITVVINQISLIFDIFRLAFTGNFYEFGEKLRILWDKGWENLSAIFSLWSDNVRKNAGTLLQNIIDFFSKTDWGKVGGDIVKGIANGITAGASWVYESIKRLIDNAKNIVAGFSGEKSSSGTGSGGSGGSSDYGYPHHASGGAAGGPTWINEKGWELVNLPNGSMVYTHAQSEQIINAIASANAKSQTATNKPIEVNINITSAMDVREMARLAGAYIVDEIRLRGG